MMCYLGRLAGEPVATWFMVLGAGVAGVHGVGTLPQARRQGIGAAMALAPLREARAMGFRVAVLRASTLGAGIYRRLGFRQCGEISIYAWWPPRERAERVRRAIGTVEGVESAPGAPGDATASPGRSPPPPSAIGRPTRAVRQSGVLETRLSTQNYA